MNRCSCILCKKEYSVKGIYTHIERTHGTDDKKSKYSSGYNGKYDILAEKAKILNDAKKVQYNLAPNQCKYCSSILVFEHRDNIFCSQSCAATCNNLLRPPRSAVSRKNTSLAVTGKVYKQNKDIVCCRCGIVFKLEVGPLRDLLNIRCQPCKGRRIRKPYNLNELGDYRRAASFKFNLKNFPDEFDFSLIEQYGWYSASNHGNNLAGVSRDHMVSVRYGFANNIDPSIIAHPANCKLMQHSSNISKYTNNSITFEELLKRIKEWDMKYIQ